MVTCREKEITCGKVSLPSRKRYLFGGICLLNYRHTGTDSLVEPDVPIKRAVPPLARWPAPRRCSLTQTLTWCFA
jgi:hypothetical protein